MHFLTRETRQLVTLQSTAALLMLLAALRIRWSSSDPVTVVYPRVYKVFDPESALELNPEIVTYTSGTPCINSNIQSKCQASHLSS
jgi:hypothetical protein